MCSATRKWPLLAPSSLTSSSKGTGDDLWQNSNKPCVLQSRISGTATKPCWYWFKIVSISLPSRSRDIESCKLGHHAPPICAIGWGMLALWPKQAHDPLLHLWLMEGGCMHGHLLSNDS